MQRGGSFNNEASNARCAARINNNPNNRNRNNGLRVGWRAHSPPGPQGPPEMQRGPRPARKLRCRGLEEKRDLFLAAPAQQPAGRIATAPPPAAPTVGAGQSYVVPSMILAPEPLRLAGA